VKNYCKTLDTLHDQVAEIKAEYTATKRMGTELLDLYTLSPTP
jgi:hypothetical protein